MPPVLVTSSAKRIATQILVIAKLSGRENLVSKVVFMIWSFQANIRLYITPSPNIFSHSVTHCGSLSKFRHQNWTRSNVEYLLLSLSFILNISISTLFAPGEDRSSKFSFYQHLSTEFWSTPFILKILI